jgi:putative ABC transport system permease protein
MFKNYLKVAFRNLLKYKSYATINILGLSLGIACSFFAYLWINDEMSYDRFHTDHDKMYRVYMRLYNTDGNVQTWETTPAPLYDLLVDDVPEVEMACRLSTWGNNTLIAKDDVSFIEAGIYADSSFFDMFSFSIISGERNKPLEDENAIVITEKLARKYFGHTDAVGKTLQVANSREVMVSAVMKDLPLHSSLQFDFVMPFKKFLKIYEVEPNWSNSDYHLYAKLYDDTTLTLVDEKIMAGIRKIVGDDVEIRAPFFLHPFKDVYLKSNFKQGQVAGGRIDYIKIFSLASLVVLVIACMNFTNLATARAATRGKEVGVRKVNGANNHNLILQFLGESLMMAVIASLIAIVVVQVLLPFFNVLVSKQIVVDYTQPQIWLSLSLITVIAGTLAGIYPAFVLSSFKPTNIMKGQLIQSIGAGSLRKVLVVFQFTLSVILIIGTVVVYKQIQYIQNKNLGFDRHEMVQIRLRSNMMQSFNVFKEEIAQHSAIKMVTRANNNPMQVENATTSLMWPGKEEDENIQFRAIVAGFDFFETFELPIIEGRSFSADYKLDNDTLRQYIISKETAKRMRLEEPIGQHISLWNIPGVIVGIADDFHSRSLHTGIDPIVILLSTGGAGNLGFARIEAGKAQDAIAHMQETAKKYDPAYPLEYIFLDDMFTEQYQAEQITGKLASALAVLAILISCMGLLGLASFTAEKRSKEMSIRKILGASTSSLLMLISKDFGVLVIASILIASPIAYLLLEKYLEQFAFHTQIGADVFVFTAALLLMVSMLTVLLQVGRAASGNPVNTLRNE